MEINEFITNFADQFDDTDLSEIIEETKFRDLEEWSSMIALSILNMIDNQYNVELSFDDMKKAITVKDLFDIVSNKEKE